MMHIGLWGSMHFHSVDERTRFIWRRGVLPWGIVVGGVMTAVLFTSLRPAPHGVRSDPLVLGFLAFVCFAEWSFLAGWLIGALLWTLKPRPNEPRHGASDKHANGEDRAS